MSVENKGNLKYYTSKKAMKYITLELSLYNLKIHLDQTFYSN